MPVFHLHVEDIWFKYWFPKQLNSVTLPYPLQRMCERAYSPSIRKSRTPIGPLLSFVVIGITEWPHFELNIRHLLIWISTIEVSGSNAVIHFYSLKHHEKRI